MQESRSLAESDTQRLEAFSNGVFTIAITWYCGLGVVCRINVAILAAAEKTGVS